MDELIPLRSLLALPPELAALVDPEQAAALLNLVGVVDPRVEGADDEVLFRVSGTLRTRTVAELVAPGLEGFSAQLFGGLEGAYAPELRGSYSWRHDGERITTAAVPVVLTLPDTLFAPADPEQEQATWAAVAEVAWSNLHGASVRTAAGVPLSPVRVKGADVTLEADGLVLSANPWRIAVAQARLTLPAALGGAALTVADGLLEGDADGVHAAGTLAAPLAVAVGSFELAIGGGTAEAWAGDDRLRAELRDVALELRLPPELLRPLSGSGRVVMGTTGSLIADRDTGLEVTAPTGFTLEPCAIGDTGFVVAADKVELDLSRTASPERVTAAGFGPEFVGVALSAAELRLPPWAGVALPAAIELQDAVIGDGGVSGRATATWSPAFVDGHFAGPGAGAVFGLAFGLDSASVVVHANALLQADLRGRILLPVADGAPLAATLRVLDGADAAELELDQPGPISVPVPGGELRAGRLRGDARVAADGSFSLSGRLDGGIELAVDDLLTVQAASAALEVEHDGADAGSFAVAVEQLRLGPIGLVDEARIRVEQRPDGSRAVALQGTVAWSGLTGRVTIPAPLPQPPDHTRATVDLRWDSADVLALTVSASVAGADLELPGFIPAGSLPEIVDASLDLRLEYPGADALAAAPDGGDLDAEVSASVRLRMPELPDVPQLDVQAGDADGIVTAALRVSTEDGEPRLGLSLSIPSRSRSRFRVSPRTSRCCARSSTRSRWTPGSAPPARAACASPARSRCTPSCRRWTSRSGRTSSHCSRASPSRGSRSPPRSSWRSRAAVRNCACAASSTARASSSTCSGCSAT